MIGNRKACAKTSSTPRAEARGRALDSRLRRCSMTQRQLLAAAALAAFACVASAQPKEIKIGFIYDVTGPFAGGGSEPAELGTKAAVDMFNEKGGVEGYRINAVFADAQSKVDVAINEMTRLIDQEKVDLIMGVYSSAQCVPMVQQIDARKKFLWVNVCIATAVFKDRQLSYVFRPQAHSDQFGAASCDYRSEEHTSELQSRLHLVCRLLLEKKKKPKPSIHRRTRQAYTRARDHDLHPYIARLP